MSADYKAILQENARRMAARTSLPDPLRGDSSSPHRIKVTSPDADMPVVYVPRTMVEDPTFATVQRDLNAWRRLRCRHDFEYWCATCCTIKHKLLGRDVRFRLNAPQRKVLSVLEADRLAGRPIRILLLKARQWGGSTLIQNYMAWIQSCHCRNWNSIICSQVKDTSAGIRGMYTKLIENYPPELWEGDEAPRFRPYERSANVREIAGRGCRVTVSSIENQDAVRGADFAMAHLSETAFWPSTTSHSPADLVRAVCGSIAFVPYTLIAMESTANGVGNYFHNEWQRCAKGEGDKHAVFIPWYDIEIYRLEPDDPAALAASLTPYELRLWNEFGCALDQINWYRHKLREYPSHDKMMAEFPTTPHEAFTATGSDIFDPAKVEILRRDCEVPQLGEVSATGTEFVKDARGLMKLWRTPQPGADYIATVDIGGRTAKSDWSVVAVLRVDGAKPEVVAQWRGHCDHDLLADKARAIATYYNEALLVVETNSLEGGVNCGAGQFILQRLENEYLRLYRREGYRVGFHTNRATKEMAVTALIGAVRELAYIERDVMACDELLTYEQRQDGSYGAKPGCHDDVLMSRAIALYLAPEAVVPAICGSYAINTEKLWW